MSLSPRLELLSSARTDLGILEDANFGTANPAPSLVAGPWEDADSGRLGLTLVSVLAASLKELNLGVSGLLAVCLKDPNLGTAGLVFSSLGELVMARSPQGGGPEREV